MCCAEFAHVAVGFGSAMKVSQTNRETKNAYERHFLSPQASNRSVLVVSHKSRIVEIDCYQVRRELSEYLEGDLTPELRVRIEDHLERCRHCTAVYDGMKNVVQLLSNEKAIELPKGFSERLYRRLFRIQ
jgi:anti-sigma factor (TIGR02949 family)